MREKGTVIVSTTRRLPWQSFCANFSAVVLLAGTGEYLEAADRHARSATMAPRIDAPRSPSIRLASLAQQRQSDLGTGRETLGDASSQRRVSLLAATTDWSGSAATLTGSRRPAADQLATHVSAPPASWGVTARFAAGAVAIRSSNDRDYRADTPIPEHSAANFHVRHKTARSVGLLRADDLVRAGEARSLGIGVADPSSVPVLGLLSNSSSLNTVSTGGDSQPSWSAPSLGSGVPLPLGR